MNRKRVAERLHLFSSELFLQNILSNMAFAPEFRAPKGNRARVLRSRDEETEYDSDTLLFAKLPDLQVLQIISRSLFLAIILMILPYFGSVQRGSDESFVTVGSDLPTLLRQLSDAGHLKNGQKGLILGSSPNNVDLVKDLEFLKDKGISVVTNSNIGNKNLKVPKETFDFVFTLSLNTEYAARAVKNNGLIITQLSDDPSEIDQQLGDYDIVYLRRFENRFIVLRKVSTRDGTTPSYWAAKYARKQALKGLEDVLMEPPRKGTLMTAAMRKFNSLPDLLGDSLESYDRRILISDDKNCAFEEWFYNNYPTRSQFFDTLNLQADEERYGGAGKSASSSSSWSWASDWIKNVVTQEDFVVMKAAVELVDEMIKDKTIHLVDELFLECDDSKRAYWHCVALYGSLKEQGISVHQWWN